MIAPLELGLDTFGDVTADSAGRRSSHARVIRDVVAEGVLADEVGLDFFGVGEHHRDDLAVSAPDVVLAAIAARTSRVRLGSAVTVLSSDDPVRVFQRFSTLDAVSNGRAEVILGRGSFVESFPLFGYSLEDYEVLFEEKLELFVALLEQRPVTWSGRTRASLDRQRVFPPTESGFLRTWVGVGGSPQSVVRAARHGLPLVVAIIGGQPLRFAPLVDLYHRSLEQFGKPRQLIAAHCPGHVAGTDEQARDELWPHYSRMHARIARERGWAPMTRDQFDEGCGPYGALFVGSPQTVASKIVAVTTGLELSRFDLKYSAGTLPHDVMMASIELYGRKVAPLVREQLARSGGPEQRDPVAPPLRPGHAGQPSGEGSPSKENRGGRVTADDRRRLTDGTVDAEPADEASADRALGAVLEELIDAIHETKQAVWLTLDAGQHRTLEELRQFLVDQATQVGEAELRIDGRSPLLQTPGAHPYENLAAKAHGDQAAMLEMLLADLENVAADVRRQAELIAGRDEAQLLTGLADGLEERLAALRP
jgi:probable LLM family oxidoreductase